MATTSWITAYLRPNTDKGPNEFTPSAGGDIHYNHVNQVPYADKTLLAGSSGLTEAFDLTSADPTVTGTITAITIRLRTNAYTLTGATSVGIRANVYNGAALVGSYEYLWAVTNASKTNNDHTFSGLSIDAADMDNLNVKLVTIGTGWLHIGLGLILLSEVDHQLTYTPAPTIVPKEIDLVSTITSSHTLASLAPASTEFSTPAPSETTLVSTAPGEINLTSTITPTITNF
jgi:hypothetical protein